MRYEILSARQTLLYKAALPGLLLAGSAFAAISTATGSDEVDDAGFYVAVVLAVVGVVLLTLYALWRRSW